MRNRIWVLILIIVLAVGIYYSYQNRQVDQEPDLPPLQESPGPEEEMPGDLSDSETASGEKTGIHPGNRVPKLQLENSEGEIVSLEQFQDRPIVLSFWVSWNEEAINQLAILENIQPLFNDEVALVGIHASAFDSISLTEALEMIDEADYAYEMLIDKDAEAQQAYYVGSFPTTFIIDSQGSIHKVYTTVVEEDQLLDDIEALLTQ